jgi:hypothetical protein
MSRLSRISPQMEEPKATDRLKQRIGGRISYQCMRRCESNADSAWDLLALRVGLSAFRFIGVMGMQSGLPWIMHLRQEAGVSGSLLCIY